MSAVCLQIISCLFTILLTHFDSKEGYQSGFSSIVIFFYVLLRILLSIFHVKLEQIMRVFCLPPVTEDFAISHWKILPDIVFHML